MREKAENMLNILLIEPKSPDLNIYSKFKLPRLGAALLGTRASEAGYPVRIIYQEAVPVTAEHLQWADVIGFSVTTSTAGEGYRLARMAREAARRGGRRSPLILFGGVHATFRPEECLEYADYVFRGEADATFVPFLEAYRSGGDVLLTAGLSWRDQDGTVRHNQAAAPADMDSLPVPDWQLFEGMTPSVSGVMGSRGCPHDCSFCSVTAMLGRKYRTRSVDRVMEDLAAVPTRNVFFYDDHFAANPKRTEELLRRIIAERGTTHRVQKFSAQVRVEIALFPHLLDLMKEAGFDTLYIGFESVDPETLKLYNKKQNLEQIESSITEIRKRGMWIHGMFVFGSDADDDTTFARTVRFARRTRIDSLQFLILTPFPGTRLYAELHGQERILDCSWDRYDGFNAVHLPQKLSPYRLQAGNLWAMRRFYTWPRITGNLLSLRLKHFLIRLYGRTTLERWARHNRPLLRRMRREERQLFSPLRRAREGTSARAAAEAAGGIHSREPAGA
jgi:radical SAM superfamily enzyme YgiQ (UPF0313 family)